MNFIFPLVMLMVYSFFLVRLVRRARVLRRRAQNYDLLVCQLFGNGIPSFIRRIRQGYIEEYNTFLEGNRVLRLFFRPLPPRDTVPASDLYCPAVSKIGI